MALLEIENLRVDFGHGSGGVRAVDGVSLSLDTGETLGLVGESGAGKSVTALAIAGLLPGSPARIASGRVLLGGKDVLAMTAAELRQIRGSWVSYIFQEPGASLNPVYRIGRQVREMLRIHRPEQATAAETLRLLKLVGIPDPELRIHNYPHELSGGMQQRAMIAIAIAARPRLLVADEPTTALDVTTQAQIIDLLRRLRDELNMAILLISHNLPLVAGLAERLAVMYAGQIVESGRTAEVLTAPLHPYTRALLESTPRLGHKRHRYPAIPGSAPAVGMQLAGCRFHPRCGLAQPVCATAGIPWLESPSSHVVRCLAASAPAIDRP